MFRLFLSISTGYGRGEHPFRHVNLGTAVQLKTSWVKAYNERGKSGITKCSHEPICKQPGLGW